MYIFFNKKTCPFLLPCNSRNTCCEVLLLETKKPFNSISRESPFLSSKNLEDRKSISQIYRMNCLTQYVHTNTHTRMHAHTHTHTHRTDTCNSKPGKATHNQTPLCRYHKIVRNYQLRGEECTAMIQLHMHNVL